MPEDTRRPYEKPAFERLERLNDGETTVRDFLRFASGLMPVVERLVDAVIEDEAVAALPLETALRKIWSEDAAGRGG